jgi:DNA primase
MSLTPQWLDELRARTTLSALIGRTVRITRAGREYKACCPFHDEKSPSFTINDEKGFYHCFGCSAHGDAIRWMTDQRGLSFMDAVKELAAEAGMDVPAPDPKAAKRAEAQAGLHDVMAVAQEHFVANLSGSEGALAREYLAKRGIKPETIKQFGIGYSLDSRKALRQELKRFGDPMLIEAGMLILVDDKEPYDRFRGRLMIPIRDARGRVIAFGGRILGAGEPKYLNSPDTPLFDKGRTLYNLDQCSPASRATKRVLVAEGYMDVIALAQAGLPDAVAPLGTALTEQQIQMLWRMTEKPYLCFDGDSAGQKAALRAALRAMPLLKPGHSLQFISLPAGQDPDDIVRAQGMSGFERLIADASQLVDYLWNAERNALPLETPEDRAGLKQRLGLHLANIADPEIRRHYADAFRERFDTLFAPAQRTPFVAQGKGGKRNYMTQNPPPSAEARLIGRQGADMLVQGVVATLLKNPDMIADHYAQLTDFVPRDPVLAELLRKIIESRFAKETLDTDALLTILEGKLYNVAMQLLGRDTKAFAFNRNNSLSNADERDRASKDLGEAIRLMQQRPALEAALERATMLASTELTEENYAEQQRLRQEKEEFDRRVSQLFQRDADI